MQKKGSREECISFNYNEMKAAGHPKEQCKAATLNFCNKQWGGIPKKKTKNEEILDDIIFELVDLEMMDNKLAEKKKWIQKAVTEKSKGKFTAYCKKLGYDGVTDQCIAHALKQGGHPAKMATFAKAMRSKKMK